MKNKVKFQLSASFVILIIIVCALFAQYICPYDPYEQDLSIAYQAPSMAHLMGTDAYGRDMFSRVVRLVCCPHWHLLQSSASLEQQ